LGALSDTHQRGDENAKNNTPQANNAKTAANLSRDDSIVVNLPQKNAALLWPNIQRAFDKGANALTLLLQIA